MPRIDPTYLEHQRKYWMRPDAYRFIRPDWRRFARPGFEDEHPFALYENTYRPDQARARPAAARAGSGRMRRGVEAKEAATIRVCSPMRRPLFPVRNMPRTARADQYQAASLSTDSGSSRRRVNRLALPLSKLRLRTQSAASRNSTRAGTRDLTLITASKAS